ncbi:MAG: DUF192 domain-containing protein [Anaerolineae bacterium]|nr:DUF192 domain-containing protein [Anaerolineae bacterium]
MPSYTVHNATRQIIIGTRIELATTPQARRVGLLKHDRLEIGHGLLIPGRNWFPFMAIHSIRMKFPIDVFFLDRNNRVLGLETLRPNRVAWVMGAQWVLEMAEGAIAVSGSQEGDVIAFTITA